MPWVLQPKDTLQNIMERVQLAAWGCLTSTMYICIFSPKGNWNLPNVLLFSRITNLFSFNMKWKGLWSLHVSSHTLFIEITWKKKEKEQRGKNEISFISFSFFFPTLFMFSSKSENVNIKLSDKIFTSAKHLFPNRLAYTLKKTLLPTTRSQSVSLGAAQILVQTQEA